MYKFGTKVGVLSQIRDDIIDYIPDEAKTWKTPFLDFLKNKKRLPLIVGIKNATVDEKERLYYLQRKGILTQKEQREIIKILFKKENILHIRKVIKDLELECLEFIERKKFEDEGKKFAKLFLHFETSSV